MTSRNFQGTAFDLTGRVALVTGAGVGIGRAVALQLAGAGAFVGIHFHSSAAQAEATLTAIRSAGGEGQLLPADLTQEDQADGMVDALVAAAGRLDILVNNTGSPLARSSIEECPTELWRRVFDVNVTCAFFICRRAIRHLRACGHGSIVNILSLSAQTGGAGGAGPYAAAKGALQVLTRTLARELAPSMRANGVMPGVIETRHHEVFSTAERMAEYRRQTPLGRNGTADEVAQAVHFLASDAASFVTGAILDINGGRFLRS
ncbi:MAG TPA: SDR family NAD(P)-dependent oxidoreductase [Pirellulales bacterium]|jgi:3-oxoacyl-[acyl-carrier protein] reductase|nr:SDR family NAD(P)-dependent oxidoreductase [Pirellulales bacterium]